MSTLRRITPVEMQEALRYIERHLEGGISWVEPSYLADSIMKVTGNKEPDKAEYGSWILSQLEFEKKISFPRAPFVDDMGHVQIYVKLTVPSAERVRLFRENQKAMGRRRLELWVTGLEREALLAYLEELRKSSK